MLVLLSDKHLLLSGDVELYLCFIVFELALIISYLPVISCCIKYQK